MKKAAERLAASLNVEAERRITHRAQAPKPKSKNKEMKEEGENSRVYVGKCSPGLGIKVNRETGAWYFKKVF